MGTINYFTSDYITLGMQPVELDEADFIDEETGSVNYDWMQADKAVIEEEAFLAVKEILEKYRFYYFHIAIKPGYYEGFSIDIESNFGVCHNDYIEKKEAQKEITEIKKFMLECIENVPDVVQVFPGWCTSYKNYEETKKGISEAIKEMRTDARTTPTWRDYEANRHYKYF